MKLKQIQYVSLSIMLLFGIVFYTPMKSFAQDSNTSASIKINSGALTLYPGDSNPDNDICSNSNISYTTANPGNPIITEGVTCNASENSISLGSISTLPIRQNPTATIDDVLFDDLRGEYQSGYTITAEISNFVDYNNSNVLALGSNPDGANATLDLGIVSGINVINGGSGYIDPPLIVISGGGGSGATASAIVSNGVVSKIVVKSYGQGYISVPTVIVVPTNGGSGAAATANIVEKDSNLNPQTSNPEEKVFVTLDPSVGTITKLKPDLTTDLSDYFTTGPRSLVTSATTQYTLFNTTSPGWTGRYDLDGTLFGLRTPAYIPSGDYRSVITLTIVAGSGIVNTPPVITDGVNGGAPNSTIAFYQASFTSHYTDSDNDPLASVTITSLPSVGILKLNGINVNVNDIIPVAQLDNLTYDAINSDYSTTFNWKASDGNDDSNTAIFTVTISAPQQ